MAALSQKHWMQAVLLTPFLICALSSHAAAQGRTDPLNGREVEQMRDTAQDPKRRIALLIGFARERMTAVERLRTSTTDSRDYTGKLAAMLDELAQVVDELDDNLDAYGKQGTDLRVPLRHVTEAEGELQKRLKTFGYDLTAHEKQRVSLEFEEAADSLESSSESAQRMLATEIAKRGEEKDKEKHDRQEAR